MLFTVVSIAQEKLNLDKLDEISQFNSMLIQEITFSNTVQTVLIFLILIFTFFVIIIAPLILMFCWLNNYSDYKRFRTNNSITTELNNLSKHVFISYRRTYSNMFGNGFGVFAWVLSSYYYVTKNINGISDGLIEYFSFPFKLLSNLTTTNLTINDAIPIEVWISMLLIVSLSIILFYLGRTLGISIINTSYNKNLLLKEESQAIITA